MKLKVVDGDDHCPQHPIQSPETAQSIPKTRVQGIYCLTLLRMNDYEMTPNIKTLNSLHPFLFTLFSLSVKPQYTKTCPV